MLLGASERNIDRVLWQNKYPTSSGIHSSSNQLVMQDSKGVDEIIEQKSRRPIRSKDLHVPVHLVKTDQQRQTCGQLEHVSHEEQAIGGEAVLPQHFE